MADKQFTVPVKKWLSPDDLLQIMRRMGGNGYLSTWRITSEIRRLYPMVGFDSANVRVMLRKLEKSGRVKVISQESNSIVWKVIG